MNHKPDWRTSTWRRAQISVIAGVGYPLVDLLGRTLRWQVDGAQHLDALAASGRPPVLGFWHGRILPATYYFRRRGIVVITSENFDGEWIARIIERFGYGTARGSTSRGARRALLQMKRVLEDGRAVAFTLDGPRGPARRAQAGAVWLAGATENPLVPFHIEAERHWTLGSWDRTQIPRPFSTTALAIGIPIPVPRDPDEAMIERKREELEHSLELLEIRAKEMLEKQQ
ncbi:MAG: lysophospholipid acyltransferase family protein [Vicinamibacterales bacterium]